MGDSIEAVADALRNDATLCADTLVLGLDGCTLRLQSNSGELINRLRTYFSGVVSTQSHIDIDVVAIERNVADLGLKFTDWTREPGKKGRKDAYSDFPDGRLVRKVRTGMLFLQSEKHRIAAGPCLAHDNQVINFINAQYMNWLQQRDWRICHAAAVTRNGQGLAVAGFSGGGKSTLMLHLLDNDEVSYLTNDRLFVRKQGGVVQAVGIPKQPRVNPGTIVHNRRLNRLIPRNRRESLMRLPQNELWALEQKYDVPVEKIYGPDRSISTAPLSAFLVLNWQHGSDQAARINPVNLSQRTDLLAAIMKSPGPFFQYADGSFYQDQTPLDEYAYLNELHGIAVYEATGRIDFRAMTGHCLRILAD